MRPLLKINYQNIFKSVNFQCRTTIYQMLKGRKKNKFFQLTRNDLKMKMNVDYTGIMDL